MKKKVVLTCSICRKIFERDENDAPEIKKNRSHGKRKGYNWSGLYYCSKECLYSSLRTSPTIECGWCHEPVERKVSQIKKSKSGLSFCNRSCACSYNNTLKRKSRRSICEQKLFELLQAEFPNVEIKCNDKDILDGYECDISIPDFKVGIEWNGIVHFKPIYGAKKLTDVQERDKEKLEIAEKKGINLIVVPDLVSNEKYVVECFYKIKEILMNLGVEK